MKPIISDETLYAYIDNELDAATRAQVEQAIAADPELAQRVERQRSLRTLLGAAYNPVLDEPVPPRLRAAAQAGAPPTPPRAKVLDLVAARDTRRTRAPTPGWTWQHWGGMAACLVIGVFAGRSAWLANAADDIASQGGQLVARGQLAQALSTQLASNQPADAPVKIGISYLSRGNDFCRSFALKSGAVAGLACRHGNDWTLRVVEQDRAPVATGDLRMAASPLPAAVLKVIDEQISGTPLDAQAERAALQRGWRP